MFIIANQRIGNNGEYCLIASRLCTRVSDNKRKKIRGWDERFEKKIQNKDSLSIHSYVNNVNIVLVQIYRLTLLFRPLNLHR